MDLLKAGSLAKKKGGGATNVEDVFSPYLYTGNSSTQTIANGIDLAGEGGLVWLKWRSGSNAFGHALYDSERGVTKELKSQSSATEATENRISSFNSSGFTLTSNTETNLSANKYVSWTFRKAPKFFDVVTWTGDGSAGPFTLSHNLGSSVGMSTVKVTSHAGSWITNHRSVPTQYLALDATYSAQTDVTMTSTDSTITFNGSNVYYNSSGRTYVAYLFADNSAEDAEQQMIKCGSFTTDASGNATVSLGWEPQYILRKQSDGADYWNLADSMRGFNTVNTASLYPNVSNGEYSGSTLHVPTADGFEVTATTPNATFIYMAIRAPMMAEPEAATDVFAIDTRNGTTGVSYVSGFPTDFVINKPVNEGGSPFVVSRLLGTNVLESANTAAQWSWSTNVWDYQNGWANSTSGASSTDYAWMLKRAKGYFDVVAYTGNGVVGRTVAHSLSVAPELMVTKVRTSADYGWVCYHKELTATKMIRLDTDGTPNTGAGYWNNVEPTDTLVTLGGGGTNYNTFTHVAYLFATLAGISKVGSYTGNGSSQTIDCGFAAGSRFILIKRTDATGDWYYWDSARGIVAGNDPHLSLNTTAAQVTTDDSVDPDNSGFIVNQNSATNINVTSATYIFYAIA